MLSCICGFTVETLALLGAILVTVTTNSLVNIYNMKRKYRGCSKGAIPISKSSGPQDG